MKWAEGERILVLGGSRGLGKALVDQLQVQGLEALSLSRKSALTADFSKIESATEILGKIQELSPTRLIYCAAGGPYGPFGRFEWKDHIWAMRVSFEFPARMLHEFVRKPGRVQQMILMGSQIAESQPDLGAASYAAAKHALKGLVTTIQLENPPFDLRLFSPGYMSTDLLPPDSAPRAEGRARDPHKIAALMIQSISDPALRLQNQSFD